MAITKILAYFVLFSTNLNSSKMTSISTPAPAQTGIKSYQRVNEETGEITDKYKYMPGMPRQYRFDGKAGSFNIGGNDIIGRTLTFQPIAWQVFTDNILGMGVKTWAELFFIDTKNCVSAVLFHGYSVDNLKRLIEPLFYDDLTLADVVLTVTAEKKNRASDNATYFLAEFSYVEAPKDKVAEYAEFVRDVAVWRGETLTANRNVSISHGYALPMAHEPAPEQIAALAEQPVTESVAQ